MSLSLYQTAMSSSLSCCVYQHSFVIYILTTPTSIVDVLDEYEYRRVHLHGYFDHTKELHMWPRSRYTGETTPTRGGPEPGAIVVTPFFCEELHRFVLVNRGWVPKRKMDPDSRQQGQVRRDYTTHTHTPVLSC